MKTVKIIGYILSLTIIFALLSCDKNPVDSEVDKNWHYEIIYATTANLNSAVESIAVSSAGNPYCVYTYEDTSSPTGVRTEYAYLNGSSWIYEEIESYGEPTYMLLDTTDTPHIVYVDYTNYDLRYAYKSGGTWVTEYVASTQHNWNRWGDTISFELSSDGFPYISSSNGATDPPYGLAYHYKDAGGWHHETILNTEEKLYSSEIALDSGNNPSFAYSILYESVVYVYFEDSEWKSDVVQQPSKGLVWLYGLDIDRTRKTHIGFGKYNSDFKSFHYGYKNDMLWQIDKVGEKEGDGGLPYDYGRLVVDENDIPHCIFPKGSLNDTDLNYASSSGSSWILKIIEDDNESRAELAVSNSGDPHILYRSWDQTTLQERIVLVWYGPNRE